MADRLEGGLAQRDPELEFWKHAVCDPLPMLLRGIHQDFLIDLNIELVQLVRKYHVYSGRISATGPAPSAPAAPATQAPPPVTHAHGTPVASPSAYVTSPSAYVTSPAAYGTSPAAYGTSPAAYTASPGTGATVTAPMAAPQSFRMPTPDFSQYALSPGMYPPTPLQPVRPSSATSQVHTPYVPTTESPQ